MPDKTDQSPSDVQRALRSDHSPGSKHNSDATPGGQPIEDVEDRENVSTVTPEDYPKSTRAKGSTS